MGRPKKKARPEDERDPDEVLAGDRAELGEEADPEDDQDLPPDNEEESETEQPESGAEPGAPEPPPPPASKKGKKGKKTAVEVAVGKAADGARFLATLPKGIADRLAHGSVEGHRYRVLTSESRGNLRLAVYQGTRTPSDYRLQVDRQGAFGQPKVSHYAVLSRDEAQEMYGRLADMVVGERSAFPL